MSLSHYISQETSHLRSSSLNTQCRQVSNSLSILLLARLEWGEGEITNRILPWNFPFEHGFGEGFEEGSGRVWGRIQARLRQGAGKGLGKGSVKGSAKEFEKDSDQGPRKDSGKFWEGFRLGFRDSLGRVWKGVWGRFRQSSWQVWAVFGEGLEKGLRKGPGKVLAGFRDVFWLGFG